MSARLLLAPMEGLLDHPLREVLTAVGGIDRCVSGGFGNSTCPASLEMRQRSKPIDSTSSLSCSSRIGPSPFTRRHRSPQFGANG